jgi:hypothetical protein
MKIIRVIVDELPMNCANCWLVDVSNNLCRLTLYYILNCYVLPNWCPLEVEELPNPPEEKEA